MHTCYNKNGNFLLKFNSTPKRDDVIQLFTLIHEDYGSIAERKDLGLQIAKEVLPADITISDVVNLLQQSRTWSFNNLMEYRMNVIKILNGDMVINPKAGTTPLCSAAQHGNPAAVKLLLSKGAEVDHKNENGHTALLIASCLGHANVVKVLLHDGRAQVNSRGKHDDRTALSHAAQWAHVEVVRILLEYGADPKLQGRRGRTAVSMAATCPNKEVLEMILHSGKADSRTPDREGRSPLVHAKSELEVLKRKDEGKNEISDVRQ